MRSFFMAMKKCGNEIYAKRDRAAADVYTKVRDFMTNASFSSYKNANLLCEMRLKGYSESEMASNLGISDNTLRIHCRNVSNDLYRIFGFSFFDMLSNYAESRDEVNIIMKRVSKFEISSHDVLLPEVLRVAKEVSSGQESYDLRDCFREIDLLRRYSVAFFKTDLEGVDRKKLNYLINVLDGEKGSAKDWITLYTELEGNKND